MTSFVPVLDIPAATPLFSTTTAKAHIRVDFTDDDTVITSLVSAATDHVEKFTQRALISQTWRQDFSAFENCMRLPFEPVSAITSITYYDSDNIQQTLASTEYTFFTDSLGTFVTLASTKSWPGVYSRPDAVRITFVAGYGASADDVPAAIKQAALLLIGAWYENRENIVVGVSTHELPMTVGAIALLNPYKRTWVA